MYKNIDTYQLFKAESKPSDCVIRALAIGLELDYSASYSICRSELGFGKFKNKGVQLFDLFKWVKRTRNNWTAYGFTLERSFSLLMHGLKFEDHHKDPIVSSKGLHCRKFRTIFNSGVYLVFSAGHAFIIKNGDLYGNYNDHNKYIQLAFKIQ